MRPIHLAISIACAGLASAAHGQLVSERLEGPERVCVYRDTVSAYTSAQGAREYRVGMAENCPLSPPLPGSAPLPPTARLTSESVSGTLRQCTYEQAGLTWRSSIPADRSCPLAAGMLAEARRERP